MIKYQMIVTNMLFNVLFQENNTLHNMTLQGKCCLDLIPVK